MDFNAPDQEEIEQLIAQLPRDRARVFAAACVLHVLTKVEELYAEDHQDDGFSSTRRALLCKINSQEVSAVVRRAALDELTGAQSIWSAACDQVFQSEAAEAQLPGPPMIPRYPERSYARSSARREGKFITSYRSYERAVNEIRRRRLDVESDQPARRSKYLHRLIAALDICEAARRCLISDPHDGASTAALLASDCYFDTQEVAWQLDWLRKEVAV